MENGTKISESFNYSLHKSTIESKLATELGKVTVAFFMQKNIFTFSPVISEFPYARFRISFTYKEYRTVQNMQTKRQPGKFEKPAVTILIIILTAWATKTYLSANSSLINRMVSSQIDSQMREITSSLPGGISSVVFDSDSITSGDYTKQVTEVMNSANSVLQIK